MKKAILILMLGAASLFSMDYGDTEVDSWRNGFITAYKAMEVDTQLQGLENKKIDTERFVIYFNTNSDDIATWDKLMIQMFGYSSSIHKPVRTTDNWIIFDSYGDKATALQELSILNDRIFKNSDKYKLEIFDNLEGKEFFTDKALLTGNLKELEELLKTIEKINLKNKEKELEDNQKVALVYVDNTTGGVIRDINEYKIDLTNLDSSKDAKLLINKNSIITKEKQKVDKKKKKADRAIFKNSKGFVKAASQDGIIIFSAPNFNLKQKIRNGYDGEVFEVDSKNGYGWYKIKSKNEYIAGHLLVSVKESEFISFNKKEKKLKTLVAEKKEQKSKECPRGFVTIVDDEVILYKVKDFKEDLLVYPVADLVFDKMMENDYKKHEYSYMIKDSDGLEYVKLLNKDAFISKDSLYISQ